MLSLSGVINSILILAVLRRVRLINDRLLAFMFSSQAQRSLTDSIASCRALRRLKCRAAIRAPIAVVAVPRRRRPCNGATSTTRTRVSPAAPQCRRRSGAWSRCARKVPRPGPRGPGPGCHEGGHDQLKYRVGGRRGPLVSPQVTPTVSPLCSPSNFVAKPPASWADAFQEGNLSLSEFRQILRN